jgi:putative transposase
MHCQYVSIYSHALPSAAWLQNSPSQTLQQTLKDLERAYKNFFEKRADFPEFKKKARRKASATRSCKLDQANSRILLPTLGYVRYRNSREALGLAKNVTVSIQTKRKVKSPVYPSTTG